MRSLIDEEQGMDINEGHKMVSSHHSLVMHTCHICMQLATIQGSNTPLILAAEKGHFPVVEFLVERGADLEAKGGYVSHVISLL